VTRERADPGVRFRAVCRFRTVIVVAQAPARRVQEPGSVSEQETQAAPLPPVGDPAMVAALLREIAAYLRLEEDPYRARAYERAAARIERTTELSRLIDEKRLTSLPGIGSALAGAITALAQHGTTRKLDELRARWPRAIIELERVPGVGPGKARQLAEALGVTTLDELAAACREGRVRELPGMGEKSEARLLAALEARHLAAPVTTMILPEGRELAEQLVAYARLSRAAIEVQAGGQTRRAQELIDGLDLVIATRQPDELRAHLRRHPLALDLQTATGESPTTGEGEGDQLVLVSGVRVAVHLCEPERLGTQLVHATSADSHWQALERHAHARGVDLAAVKARSEAELYATLALPELPAELREGEEPLAQPLGRLITVADVRGAVHCHTTYSDGKDTVATMAQAALSLGLAYLTITDHSPTAHYAGGLTLDRLRAQWDEIDEVQARVGTRLRLLKGTEADILADGALDWPDEVLERLDVIIASVHQRYKLDEDAVTRRLVRALETPIFKIWGHPLGRLVGKRPPIACRIDEVLAAAARTRTAIEINGDPHRLDLEPALVRRARALGCRFVVSTDAHSARNLAYVHTAVDMARRGRLGPADVLNCLPTEAFLAAVRPVA
jgi:DNA polymerase (family 10)